MTTIVVVAVAVAVVVRRKRRERSRSRVRDGQRGGAGLLLATAAHLFPPERRGWARAMLAELDEVPGTSARWRFALGGAWAGIVASGREPVPVAGIAVVVGVAGGVGAVTYAVSPATHVLGIALALALVLAGVSWPRRRAAGGASGAGPGLLGITLLAGVAACLALTLYGVAAYPAAAADDDTTAYSLVLAATLGAYVWVGSGAWPGTDRDGGAGPVPIGLLFGTGYAGAGVVADHTGQIVLLAVVGLAGLAAAGAHGARLVRRGTIGRGVVVAGLRTGLVAGLAFAVASLSATYLTASWTVRDQEVLAGFRASGLSDLADHLVREALTVSIGALVGLPMLVLGATWAGSAFVRSRQGSGPHATAKPTTTAASSVGEGDR